MLLITGRTLKGGVGGTAISVRFAGGFGEFNRTGWGQPLTADWKVWSGGRLRHPHSRSSNALVIHHTFLYGTTCFLSNKMPKNSGGMGLAASLPKNPHFPLSVLRASTPTAFLTYWTMTAIQLGALAYLPLSHLGHAPFPLTCKQIAHTAKECNVRKVAAVILHVSMLYWQENNTINALNTMFSIH